MGLFSPLQQSNTVQSSPNTSPKKKILSLQGLRAVAFLAIFISHSRLGQLGYLGAWGVSVFFVLSGFLMFFNYYPREKLPDFGWRFSWNKIKQLYPLHIVTMLFSIAFALFTGLSPKKTALDAVLHTFLLQIWVPNEHYYATLNGPSWFLCVSFFCYLCFPLILRFFKRKINTKTQAVHGGLFLFFVAFILSGLTFLLHRHDNTVWFNTKWITYYFPPVRLIDFTLGCFLGAIYLLPSQKTPRQKNALWVSCITLVLIVLSLLFYYRTEEFQSVKSVKYSLLFLPTSLLLIWTLLDQGTLITRLFSCRVLVAIGDLSPYTFLIHGVIIKYAYWILSGLTAHYSYFVVLLSFMITLSAAVLYKKAASLINNPTHSK